MTEDAHDPFSRDTNIEALPQTELPAVKIAPLDTDMPGEDVPEQAVAAGSADAVMTRDEFYQFTMSFFPVVGGMVAMRDPPPLKSLMTAGELPSSRPASDAVYDMAESMPWMRWLISKDSKWLQQMLAIGAFGSQLFASVSEEVAERAKAREAEDKRGS